MMASSLLLCVCVGAWYRCGVLQSVGFVYKPQQVCAITAYMCVMLMVGRVRRTARGRDLKASLRF